MDLEVTAKLKEYKELLDEGILTQEEFDDTKKLLLQKQIEIEKVTTPSDRTNKAPQKSVAQNNARTSVNESKLDEVTAKVQQAKAEGFLTNDEITSTTQGTSGAERWQNATLDAFRNMFNFRGRLNKTDYWWAVLSILIITVVASVFCLIPFFGRLILFVWVLVLTAMGWSMAVRRLHDLGRPWQWTLLTFSGIGGIVLLIWFLSEGEKETNQWG